MSFRPQYGVPYNHYPPQPIVFGHMRMPGQNPPPKPAQSTPVFVGNISEKCSDEFMEKMLQECGRVVSWKRIKGTNGRLQAFGFCDFADAEGTLRALRILNEFHLGDKKLTVKAEEKIRDDLRKNAIEIRKRQGKKELRLKEGELPVDDDDLKKDEEIRLKILHWIEHDHPELLTVAEDGEISDKEVKKETKEDRRSVDRSRKDQRRRSRSRGRGSRSPKNKRRRSRSSSSSSDSRSSRSYSRSSNSSRSRSRTPAKKTKKRRDHSETRSSENEEDARERRLIKQQVKEKEQAYLARLKRWESREKQRSKIYEKEERKEKDRKKDIHKEAKRLKVFLEDYDDEKDDPKFYKSSMLFKRKREFEREKEADQKDRLKEQQEIEELKKQILEENKGVESNVNLEEEAMKRHKLKEDEALKKMRADSGSPNPHQPLGHNEDGEESSSSEGSGSDGEGEEDGEKQSNDVVNQEEVEDNSNTVNVDLDTATPEPPKPPSGWKAFGSSEETTLVRPSLKSPNGSSQPAQTTGVSLIQPIAQRLNGVFGNDDEDDEMRSKKKLKPLEITREERMQVMSADEKRTLTRQIIKNLPTGREELFATPIEWDYIDKNAMETRIKPWVTKKVQEFLGEEEKPLVDFICEKIESKSSPEQILKDIAMIIDDDADQFVVKMWRLLVYEGRARKMGVS